VKNCLVCELALPVAEKAKLSNRKKHRDLQTTVPQGDNVFDRRKIKTKHGGTLK